MKNKQRIVFLIAIGLLTIGGVRVWVKSPAGQEVFKKLASKNTVDPWPADRKTFRSSFFEVMGTFGKITVVAMDEDASKKAAAEAKAELDRMQRMFDWRIADSEVAKLNSQASYGPVKMSDEVFEVLNFSVSISHKTGGKFDVTVGPIIDLWKDAQKNGQKPSQEEIEQAELKVGYHKLDINPETKELTFAIEGMRLDFGAVAKGYAIDKAIEAIKRSGAIGGMVDVGGDISCFGAPPKGSTLWKIGLQDPRKADYLISDSSDILLTLKLASQAIATSGDYRRFVEVDGEKESHIIDPGKGKGAKEFSSVSVIASDAKTADALATAVSVMGLEGGLELIEDTPDVEAIVIPHGEKFEIIKTSGLDKLLE